MKESIENPMSFLESHEHMDGGVNVLLVDDNSQNLKALEAILDGPRRRLVKVSSGEEALRYLLHNDCSVVLLDIKMSGMDGFETANLIRSRERTKDLPIIFLTSYSKDEADVLRGYSYGAVDYIFKPIVPDILKTKVDVFVELFRKNAELKRKNEDLERAERELMRTQAAESIIKHAPDPVFLSDLTGTILQANDAAFELLGVRPDEIIEQSLTEFLPAEEMGELLGAVKEVVESGLKRNVTLHPRKAGGDIIPTVLNMSALRNAEGKVIGAIGILRDMRAFEKVLSDLQRSKSELMEKIMDLEKFEQVVVGRELKMIELEKEVKRLQQSDSP